MRVTIKDIAKNSGFSCSTVSRVITNSPNVDPETREKINAIIQQCGYRPNFIARGLVNGQINIVALVVGDIGNQLYAELTKGAEEVLNQAGYMVVLCHTNFETTKEENFVEAAVEYGFAGLIMATSLDTNIVPYLKGASCPVVLVNRYLHDLASDVVSVDNVKGGYLAARHLIELGHQKIALLAGPKNSVSSSDRIRGFQDAMQEAGLQFENKYFANGDFKMPSGYDFGRYLLAKCTEISAAFCTNDLMALGLIQAFTEVGKAVPDDFSVVGYDDSPLALIGKLKLTTVHQPHQEMGRAAANMVLSRIKDETSEASKRMIFGPSLVVRESTRAN